MCAEGGKVFMCRFKPIFRSKFETEQRVISELSKIHEEITEFQSSWEGKKITLATKLEELIHALTETEN